MRMFIIAAALAVAGFVFAGTASATPHQTWWLNHSGESGNYHCDAGHHDSDSVAGPFDSKAQCEALLTPTSGQVCNDGETLTVDYPNLYLYENEDATAGACEIVTPPPGGGDNLPAVVIPQTSGSFLCYAIGGDQFYAATSELAQSLQASGYWLPTALFGNVAGATNLGSYHLVCREPGDLGVDGNAPPAQWYVDDNGYALDWNNADSTGFVGVYPVGLNVTALLAVGFVG